MTDAPTDHQTMAQLLQQGLFHHRRGEVRLAMERYSDVLTKDPKNAEALYYVAVISCQEGQFTQGVDLVRRALTLVPPEARMLNLLGQALDRLGQPLEAVKALDQAIALDPKLAAAHANRANILIDAGMPAEALEGFDRALALNPDSPAELINRGGLLESFGRAEDALKDYDRALALAPEVAEVHANRASVLKDMALLGLAGGGDDTAGLDEAVASYTSAIKLKRSLHEAYVARGQIKLMRGDWPPGFADVEHRAELTNPDYKPLPDTRWDGSAPRAGERLVLVADQGPDDILQFCRFAPALAAQGHDVVVLAHKGMAPLLSTLQGVTVVSDVTALEAKRPLRWLPLMSVPAVLGTTPETLPRDVPYLAADPARVEAWAGKLGDAPFKIGIAWATGTADRSAATQRSLPLTAFKDLAALPGVELIALQKGPALAEIKGVAFRDKIRTIDADMNADGDFLLDAAAVVSQLDLVIGCDAAIVHLAGALGRPVFVAVPAIPDWRWMLTRDDSPWYPTLRIFRQDVPQQWGPVFERIALAVRERLK
ncbi:MAG: tetratricopeptide repeat-containing glycosyltransferase family protein [Pseudolabrys sp.]|nr:tetratricopeptide repeat-containing glycosyltransferase family protein [Pseudolabrys sp.]MDP2299062.1 tetratricopeptide repeat-containing glycosyltransferase family protein [Pseudolabrys sp.]